MTVGELVKVLSTMEPSSPVMIMDFGKYFEITDAYPYSLYKSNRYGRGHRTFYPTDVLDRPDPCVVLE